MVPMRVRLTLSVVMFQSGTHWLRPQTCQQCRCDNGVLYCTRQTCPDNPLCPQVGLHPHPTPLPPYLSLSLSPSLSLFPSLPLFVSLPLFCLPFTLFVSLRHSLCLPLFVFLPLSVCFIISSDGGDPDVNGYEFRCMFSSYHMMNLTEKQDVTTWYSAFHNM